MKLYTEEHLRKAYGYGVTDGKYNQTEYSTILEHLIPIELPSDEEIEKELLFGDMIEGAKWMKQQILNQNK